MPAYLNSMSNLILRSKLPADKDPHKYGKVEQVGNKKKKNSKVHNFIHLVIKSYCCLLLFYNILVNLEKSILLVLSFIHADTRHFLDIVQAKLWKMTWVCEKNQCSHRHEEHLSISEGVTARAPAAFCVLNIKRAVNSVFTHGSFHWIKARGCCVSLDSHHYARWILMSATHWGAVLKRTKAGPRFSALFQIRVSPWPSACHQDYASIHAHRRTHEENTHRSTCTHTFLPPTRWWKCSTG